MTLNYCVVLLLISAFIANGKAQEPNRMTTSMSYNGAPLPLSEWISVGPFGSESDKQALETKFHLGLQPIEPENNQQIDLEALESSLQESEYSSMFKRLKRKNEIDFYSSYASDGLDKTATEASRPSFYVQSRISSSEGCQAYLLSGSDGQLRIWLNGVLVSTVLQRRGFDNELFNAFSKVTLKKGDNMLLIKVANVAASCGLVAELVPSPAAALSVLLDKNGSCFHSLFVDERTPLSFELRGYPSAQPPPSKVIVTDDAGRNVGSWNPQVDGSRWNPSTMLTNGIYHAHFSFPNQDFVEDFLVGDPVRLANPLIKRVTALSMPPDVKINLETLITRISILFDPENTQTTNREWQRKVVFTIDALSSALRRYDRRVALWGNVPGLHLRGFKSHIDGQVRHYRLFIPNYYDSHKPLPIAIVAATAFSGSRPFLESSFVSHQLDAETLAKIAERNGIGLLWPGYPAQPYGNPCEFTHLNEVISEVTRDYNIDRQRMYLLGTCQGGMTATMFAEQWPRRFAAVALLDPMASRDRDFPRDESEFAPFLAYREWLSSAAPLKHLERLKDVAIYVVHDDGAPGHGSIEEAMDVVNGARDAHLSPDFKHAPLSLGHMDAWEDLIAWVVTKRQTNWSDAIASDSAIDGSRTGPVMTAFSDGFILVKGTKGDASESAAIRRITDQFEETWEKTYYGRCPIIDDYAVTEELERTTNLVLIGNVKTNAAWKRLEKEIPLDLGLNSSVIDGTSYPIHGAAIEAVFRHLRFQDRRIVVIGASDLIHAHFGAMNLSIDGWFDYAFWGSADAAGESKLVVAENYRAH